MKWLRDIMENRFSRVPRPSLPKPWPTHSRRTASQTSTSQLYLSFLHCLATLWCAFISVGTDSEARGGGSQWKIGRKLRKVQMFNIKAEHRGLQQIICRKKSRVNVEISLIYGWTAAKLRLYDELRWPSSTKNLLRSWNPIQKCKNMP